MSALTSRSPSRQGIRRSSPWFILSLLLLAGLPAGLAAQPFGLYLGFNGGTGAVTVPNSPSLNPSSALTVEAWVNLSSYIPGDEEDLLGKGWTHSWSLFVNPSGILRTYVHGCPSPCSSSAFREGGFIPLHEWTHVALVFDGVNRYHYINGELVLTSPDPGPIPSSTQPVELGSDPDYHGRSLKGFLDEVRIWSVARTQAQLRSTLQGFSASTPTTGLVAFWPLNGNANDIFAGHNGSLTGSPLPVYPLPPAVIAFCVPAPGVMCLSSRFIVTVKFRTGPQTNPESAATPVSCSNPDSGLFWFFSPDNWEVMIKTINACSLNSRYWVFTAATTNVFYRMEVYDVRSGINRIYFNYQGPPAPAVTDTDAFATCP